MGECCSASAGEPVHNCEPFPPCQSASSLSTDSILVDMPSSGSGADRNGRSRIWQAATSFGRDITVNVIANLVAAAVVYLGGVSAGLLPQSPKLVAASVTTLLSFTGIALFAVSRMLRGVKRLYTAAAMMIAIGVTFSISVFTGTNYFEPIPTWLTFVFGLVVIAFGGFCAWIPRYLGRYDR